MYFIINKSLKWIQYIHKVCTDFKSLPASYIIRNNLQAVSPVSSSSLGVRLSL